MNKVGSIGIETYQKLFKEDKQLDQEWFDSLAQRGHALDGHICGTKADNTLKFIGMPVGGIGCGTVYLSGDGRLFVWDIFNEDHLGVVRNRCDIPKEFEGAVPLLKAPFIDLTKLSEHEGSNYVNPPTADAYPNIFEQHFALVYQNKRRIFEEKSWQTVEFTGSWPMGHVRYSDNAIPLDVSLKAYSPFIPLNLKDSSLPATIMHFTVENTSAEEQTVQIEGILENASLIHSRKRVPHTLKSEGVNTSTYSGVFHSVAPKTTGDREKLRACRDYGSMMLTLLEGCGKVDPTTNKISIESTIPANSKAHIIFIITWFFPSLPEFVDQEGYKRHYINDFKNAKEVADYVAKNFERLSHDTQTWVDTWNDSTLPQWLLDRVLLTSNMLQTQTCYIFDDGRFWAYEGVGCCPGTCTHVWHYAQGVARLFPELERSLREQTDFSLMRKDGGVDQRGAQSGMKGTHLFVLTFTHKRLLGYLQKRAGDILDPVTRYLSDKFPYKKGRVAEFIEFNCMAVDGQAGTVLRSYREHLVSPDNTFLKDNWSFIKRAMQYLIDFDAHDENGINGMLSGKQFTTWDAYWYGTIHAMCSLYLAALYAAKQMATEVGDKHFSKTCDDIYQKGVKNFETLYNGEFYEHLMDEEYTVGTGKGCFIDQILGEFWAIQMGKDHIHPIDHVESTLNSIWRYNYIKDVGPFRDEINKGRIYAKHDEGGVIMTTWPNGGLTESMQKHFSFAYFNEVWAGQEYQLAATMIATGKKELIQKGLAIIRTVHDRYNSKKRNPYNEIECSDHYARSNTSHGVLLAASGFYYHGPKGILRFDPKINAENFKAAFTAAQGWGSYAQEKTNKKWKGKLELKYGQLRLNELTLPWITPEHTLQLNGEKIEATVKSSAVIFLKPLILNQGDELKIL